MRKSELMETIAKLRQQKLLLQSALVETRQVARDCVSKGTTVNSVWIIEKATSALTKSECL